MHQRKFVLILTLILAVSLLQPVLAQPDSRSADIVLIIIYNHHDKSHKEGYRLYEDKKKVDMPFFLGTYSSEALNKRARDMFNDYFPHIYEAIQQYSERNP